MGAGIVRAMHHSWNVYLIPRSACDVTDLTDVMRLLSGVTNVDCVVNLAGVSHPTLFDVEHPSDASNSIADELLTNAHGSFNVALATCAEHPKATQIYIASVAGMYGKPEHAGYSASKAAVISMVQSLGMEGYEAYAISPGRVDTKMREKDYPGEDKRTRLTVDEIGQLVRDITLGEFEPGDNVVIRRIGHETQPLRTDDGEPWRTWLAVAPRSAG
jgi:NAD(P)-dependent dehydrogenase (short-subunit alcohol dehydrogenase family)